MKIALIGMMGCGKSTIGEKLSERLNIEFTDTDEYIEKTENKSINDIFKDKSEEYFRKVENKAIEELSKKDNIILSTGGGIIKNKNNIDILIENNFIIIFIERDINKIVETIEQENRPLIRDNINKLYNIYKERESLYKEYSNYTIQNNDLLDKALEQILKLVINL